MLAHSVRKNVRTVLLALLTVLAICRPASAELLYATSVTSGTISIDNTTTGVVTPFYNDKSGADLDSLFFDPSGRIIYDRRQAGVVRAYDPVSGTNVRLYKESGSQLIDMALEPSKTSFLVSDANNDRLDRISLSGSGLITSLNVMYTSTQAGRPDGVIYDAAGRLFVNVSTGFTSQPTHLEQIDPTTGAILQTVSLNGIFLDGLTYDSYTGMLWASDYDHGRIVEINPNNLSYTVITPSGASIADNGPDGIVSDGKGYLFIASRANNTIIQYDIATKVATAVGSLSGVDDLAPVSGLGAPTPEPSSILIVSICGLGMIAYRLRRRSA
jgi:sugar lactone lactonase YvrE